MHTQLSDTNSEHAKKDTERVTNLSLYFILPCLLIAGIYVYSVHFLYGFSLFPDEFGYWSSAAAAIGYDWSEVTSLGYYYSFGYALILMPILKIFGGGVAAYRAAVFVNMILHCVSLWLMYGLLSSLFPDRRRLHIIICSVIGVMYPVRIYYMHLTMVEAVLAFTYILICFLTARYMERPDYGRLFPVLLALTYMYYLHMRTIAVFAAGIIILVIHAVNTDISGYSDVVDEDKGRTVAKSGASSRLIKILVIIISAAIALYVGEVLKSIILDRAYSHGSARQLETNDYAGQISRLEILINPRKWPVLIESFISKLMYLGMSSFGMVYIAVIYLLGQTLTLICGKKYIVSGSSDSEGEDTCYPNSRKYTCLFILLTAAAQYMLIAAANTSGRLDSLPYGRYIEHLSPVMMAVGVCALSGSSHRYRYLLGSIAYNALAVTVTTGWSVYAGTDNMHSYCIAGISYLWNEWDTDITGKYLIVFIVSAVTMIIIYLCIGCISRYEQPEAEKRMLIPGVILPTLVIVTVEILLGMHLNYMYVYPSSSADKIDGRIAEYIDTDSVGKPGEDIRVIYISEGNPPFVDVVQFYLMDTQVSVVRARSRYEEIDSSLISGSDTKYSELDWIPDSNNRDY